ncbi:YlbG family protein [Lactobacillus hominis]|uniref:YlbG family protein n=1 Tax=Lactobacillus hominis TaxID=1203033 RepID=UPI0023F170B7|nr:YlbG family protein [Lactobacillus hominis]
MGLVFDDKKSEKIQNRRGLIIWLYQSRDQYKLRHYGDIVYFSQKNKYVMMYIPADKKEETINELKKQRFVKYVEESRHSDLDFSDEHEEKIMNELKVAAEKIIAENEDYKV